ncbi:MAG: L,D-transpeptidase family protein [Thermodesulfobacteriaceae bacterium]|nr:L,D-transpeptidase family protein [Thermodesulfobacteriaceae bacterium]MCX8041647.1 L,D-transpeptidase family protein [Thermodesulfobacteriaceae bacterium]MDW8136078.1 L,D-transpeptidase family protein [Thermodesulfobacterium sp.]
MFYQLIPQKFLYFQNFHYTIKDKDTLVDLAVYFKVGYYHLTLANPGIDPWVPPVNQKIVIPKKILIPEEFLNPSQSIVINLAEKRLYYFKNQYFFVAPIGIGVEGSLPPLGVYTIIDKKEKPHWYPPPSIRKEDPSLPEVVPPGPENPMGDYALYLSRGLYAIHGTNKIYSIGRRTTHGCFRLYPEHIKFLYENVPVGTLVKIVYEPYKIAFQNGKIYLQVYPDFEKRIRNPFLYIFQKIEKLSETKRVNFQIDLFELEKALKNQDGNLYSVGEIK